MFSTRSLNQTNDNKISLEINASDMSEERITQITLNQNS